MFSKYDIKRFDYIVVILIILLAICGVVAIGSATRINSPEGTDLFRNKQIIGFVTGGVLMLFFAFFNYKWIGKLVIPIFLLNIALLLAVLVAGEVVNGAKRWIDIGPFRLQPSEFSKIFTILVLAKYFDKFKKHLNNIAVIIGALILTGVPMYLIYSQPDLSTSMIMIVILGFMIFVAGISYWYILIGAAVVIPAVMWGINYIKSPGKKFLEDYQVDRILSLIDPTKVAPDLLRQTNNSLQAIGSGKLFGKGLYLGKVNQYDYLPEPQTDFIFAIIGEEFGFFGCFVVLFLLFLLVIRIIWIAKDSPDLFGKLIITGYSALLLYQIFINVGVVTGIAPNTGMTLPFISYGVSSLWNNLIGIGIILNISMQRVKVGNNPPISGVNTKNRKRGSTA